MQQEQGRAIVELMTLGRVGPEETDELMKLQREGFSAVVEGRRFPVTGVLQEFSETLIKNGGMAEEWLLLQIIAVFAQGVAAGRGRREMTKDDIAMVGDGLCEKWPDCSVMRIDRASEALRLLAKAVQ